MVSQHLVWLITGTSSGLGRDLALAALERGEKVIATARARSFSKIADLKEDGAELLQLDVTFPLETLQAIAKEAINIYGRIDVLVNNAGYITVGALEECTPQETIEQFNTNVFGGLNVSRALLPYMREQKSGTIAFIGSMAGWVPAPMFGLYAATKYAMRGLSEALHEEISPFGLRSICFEAGYFRTHVLMPANRAPFLYRISDYRAMNESKDQFVQELCGNQQGDPRKGAEVILDVIRGEGAAVGRAFPTVLALGGDCYATTKDYCQGTIQRLEDWKDVTFSTEF